MTATGLLEVEGLSVRFPSAGRGLFAVRRLDLAIAPGEAVALVGESGAGKSSAALALLDLLPPGARVDGRIAWEGREVLGAGVDRRATLRGSRIAMVFQDPAGSFDPVATVGDQIAEVLRRVRGLARGEARRGARALLEEVRLPDAEATAAAYPHQLSGGMCQRAALAAALASGPALLVADEPTSALDVTVQAGIVRLLRRLRRTRGLALLFITHDLALVPEAAERAAVMRDGLIVEAGPAARILSRPEHPFTRELVAALPERWPGREPAPGGKDGRTS